MDETENDGDKVEFDRILNKTEVANVTGISPATIDRLRDQDPPAFPAPVSLSKRRQGWRSSAVRQWLSERPEAP